MPTHRLADPDAVLHTLLAECGPAAAGRGHAARRPEDPDALLAVLTAEVALPLPPPRPRPAPPQRLLSLTPVPVLRTTPAPRRVPAIEASPPDAILPPPEVLPRVSTIEVSAPPPEIPAIDDLDGPAVDLAAEVAVDDFDILETDDSIGPGGVSVEDVGDADVLASVELGPEASVGDLDALAPESTVDRDLKAFFADESVEGSLGDNALLRPRPGENEETSSPSGPRTRRDNSLLTNVKKLFKK
jgi:hypothetical protein